MTVAIPSFQRRTELERLVCALDEQVSEEPDLADGLTFLVVLDGSTDGSREMLAELELVVPLEVRWQPNAGRAAARNTALDAAAGELILFVDDDMVPAPGLLRRHRLAHDDAPAHLLVGPCRIPPQARTVSWNREWADHVYNELAAAGRVEDPGDFHPANTSGPLRVFREMGGFDERFVGWGGEDYEFGYRLLKRGIPIHFDETAVAWHVQRRGVRELCHTKVDEGRNSVRIAHLHPDAIGDLFAPHGYRREREFFARLPLRGARGYRALGGLLAAGAAVEHRIRGGKSTRLLRAALTANRLAGIAELDPGGALVRRVLAPGGTERGG